MSRPRSRSPLFSRIPTLHGRRADGFLDGQIQSSVPSNAWRNNGYDTKAESSTQWNKDSFQGNQQVDHWAKFIDAIEHAQKREALPMSTFHMQDDEERPPCSPRRLPRERLPSPDHARFDMEERFRMSGTPGWNRSGDSDRHLGRHETILQQNQRDSRHSEARRYNRAEYEFHNEELGNQYQERSSFSERSSKSDFREHHLSSEDFMHLGQQNEYVEDHTGFSPRRAPVIVEHDHGISKRESRNRDPPRTSDHPRSRDPPRRNETPRNREPLRDHRRDQGHHPNTSQGRHSRAPSNEESRRRNIREESRRHYSSYEGEGQVRDRSRHMDRSRTDSLSRDLEGRWEMDQMDIKDIDLRTQRSRTESDNEWDDERFEQNNGRMMEQQEVCQRAQYQRNPNSKSRSVPRMDFGEQETLKIKVDMSRPVGQSSYLGYSSDRQLSLDLVNVGRQRLDFLPMLEHSGTYRESAVHSGTFAQEIITLVHQVKENYFKGQGITLNQRFANEQYYSLQDELEEEEEDEEMESLRPIMNRQLGMPLSETQIFCKINSEPPQKRQLVPDPSDLRYDLERRRQQRLEGVKITIAGGSFSQMAPESQGSDRPYARSNPDRSEVNFGRSEPLSERPRQWNGSHESAPAPNRQNLNPRSNSNRNNRPRGRRT